MPIVCDGPSEHADSSLQQLKRAQRRLAVQIHRHRVRARVVCARSHVPRKFFGQPLGLARGQVQRAELEYFGAGLAISRDTVHRQSTSTRCGWLWVLVSAKLMTTAPPKQRLARCDLDLARIQLGSVAKTQQAGAKVSKPSSTLCTKPAPSKAG